ncbi:hypothetical protein G6O69_18255 [Pseudenhygromyxa sp. WMMC2535]|uniref:hypothetical protein n=1 Tax=Pseudenhygromyxa sp. WMMC2535 TaxID=2712867 RepID=UPI0015951926|nr:hypothetical protein [Pseudenhygromyxa sp. WMMC2535]NVB39793.1 hypothetical protein [Pseudenhygromyxa sp. WMMC2535]
MVRPENPSQERRRLEVSQEAGARVIATMQDPPTYVVVSVELAMFFLSGDVEMVGGALRWGIQRAGQRKAVREGGEILIAGSIKRKGKKRGPKTDPNAPHNAKIRSEAKKLEEEGNVIIGGGGRKEQLIHTRGGHKSGRRPDILYRTPEGNIRGRNVGRTRADGSPVKREVEALEDLNGPGQTPTDFTPYDR